MGPLEILIVLFVLALWIAPAYLIARWVERKGHSFVGFFVLGLVLGPLITAIIAALVPDHVNPRPVEVVPGPSNHLDRLEQITDLRDRGTLTQAEFDAERLRILESR